MPPDGKGVSPGRTEPIFTAKIEGDGLKTHLDAGKEDRLDFTEQMVSPAPRNRGFWPALQRA